MAIRHDELKKSEEDFFNSLPEDAQHQMIVQNDVTFETWVLSATKDGDIIEIDYYNHNFEVVGHY